MGILGAAVAAAQRVTQYGNRGRKTSPDELFNSKKRAKFINLYIHLIIL